MFTCESNDNCFTMPKIKCVFNDELQRMYPSFKQGKVGSEVFCIVCHSTVSIASKGSHDILEHTKTAKHQKNLRSQAGSSNQLMTDFLTKSSHNQAIRASEGALAYHTVCHHMSFNSLDCTVAINRKMFHDSSVAKEITCNRTKGSAIVCNVLAPHSRETCLRDLENISALSVSTNASNHRDVKMFPIMIQYFNVGDGGATTKLLDIVSRPNETSDTISDIIIEQLEKYDLASKCVAFGADNCNTNFGGRERTGSNNVYCKLKNKLQKDVIGIGCPAHIINNAVHHGCDTLPTDVESMVMKIYNHFSVYTVRCESLKQFCLEAEAEYKKLLYHSKTRWLSLYPAVERILRLYGPLKNYFSTIDKPPTILKMFFENDFTEAYLYLIHSTMIIMHNNIQFLERHDNSIIETLRILTDITASLESRVEHKFVPMKIREIMRKLEEGKEISEFNQNAVKFYEEMRDYLKSWTYPLQEFKIFSWMDLTCIDQHEWTVVEGSLLYLQQRGITVDDSQLFNEWVNLKLFAIALTDEEKKKKCHELWCLYIQKCSTKELYRELLKIAEFFFCIPAHNANVERVFSLVSSQWTDERNQLSLENVSKIIMTKFNFKKFNCSQFYDYILKQHELLRQVGSSEKYEVTK